MNLMLLSQYVLSGLVIGLIYSLMTLGITFIYGIMKMINRSIGEFYMIGSYVQYALLGTVFGWDRWYLALPLAMASVFPSARRRGGRLAACCDGATRSGK